MRARFWLAWAEAITNFGNSGNLPTLPLGLNYDSKGFIAFNPGDFALDRGRVASNRPPIALNRCGFIDHLPIFGA